MGGVSRGGGPDLREHVIGFAQELVVPDAKDSEPLAHKPGVTPRVRNFSNVVYSAVDLDDNPMRQTAKIDDIPTNRRLPAKTKPVQLLAAKYCHSAFSVDVGDLRSVLALV